MNDHNPSNNHLGFDSTLHEVLNNIHRVKDTGSSFLFLIIGEIGTTSERIQVKKLAEKMVEWRLLEDEYIMIFAPVKDRKDCILEVGDDSKIPLTK